MRTSIRAAATLALSVVALTQALPQPTPPSVSDRASLDRYIYPLSPPLACPPVEVDTSQDPEAAAWGDAAKHLIQLWFPYVTELMDTRDHFRIPRTIRLVIKPTNGAPAYTENDTITCDSKWIAAHPDDLGMVVHELTHVVQQYTGRAERPGWLVEGMADYVRWWKYQPEAQLRKPGPNATYHDAYRTTAYFLAWVSYHYDERLVPQLDHAMKIGEDPVPIFKQLTGKEPQELWDEMEGK